MIHLKSFTIWQRVFKEIDIFTLDFINAGIMSPYEGVLGLDLMKQFCITLNFNKGFLKIE